MSMDIYTGRVSHQRCHPRVHRFSYGVTMVLLDIRVFDNGSHGKLLPAWLRWLLPLRRRDHLKARGPVTRQLGELLTTLVRERSGMALDPQGQVFLLTGPGFLWHRFNPVSFYYCYNREGDLDCLVAEVTNTPWHEQSYYVLDARAQRDQRERKFSCAKEFHVSPFMPMDTGYHWRMVEDKDELAISIEVERKACRLFSANLALVKRPLTATNLLKALGRQPFMSLSVAVRIHWQALRLWLKATPFYPHPRYSSGDK